MNILKTNRHTIGKLISARSYTTDLYPYTTELFKQNYIKYTKQAKINVTHDYVYTGDERLPTFSDRMKGTAHIILNNRSFLL
jgi:hypothetical protein